MKKCNNENFEGIRIKNFRCFVDTGDIKINKVNVLLGQNSSGKSSFLNLFPMFKESVNNELRSPILWFSEGVYDFGSFKDSHCRFSNPKDPIVFEFHWFSLQEKISQQCNDCPLFDRTILGFMNANSYRLIISVNSDNNGDYIEEIVLYGDSHSVKINCSKTRKLSFFIDGEKIKSRLAYWTYGTKGIFPNVRFKGTYFPPRNIQKRINSLIPDNYQDSLSNSDYQKLYDINSLDPSAIYSYYEENRENNPFMDFILKAHKFDSKEFQDFCNDISLSIIIASLMYAEKCISSTFEVTSYMLPVRYAFGRYIRNKNLAVEKVTPSGDNVMEFLLSLNVDELAEFNDLLDKVLKVKVMIEGDDNKSIFIQSKMGKDNIVDVGYGFTQILPIVTLLWNIARRSSACEYPYKVIIEQPEVHLHPSLQGDVAQLISEIITLAEKKKSNLQIFIETHSEAFVNRLGRCIRNSEAHGQGGILSEEVSVLLFEKTEMGSKIVSTKFGKDGYVEKWPIGFLN